MPTPRSRMRSAAVLAAAILTVAASVTATAAAEPHSATAIAAPRDGGIAYLPTTLDLQPTASRTWTDTALEVILPRAGTYDLDVDVRGVINGYTPVDTWISARLLNVTSGTVLPNSERLVTQVAQGNTTGVLVGTNGTAPISERITVNGPTLIRLQGMRVNFTGASHRAEIISSAAGRTSFRYERV
jgi:hypothetical protein